MRVLGLDIGGANLKFASADGEAHSAYFPMWIRWQDLKAELHEALSHYPGVDRVAITMTGEMADCFATRREGVEYIVDAVASAFAKKECCFYSVDGRWLTSREAKLDPWSVAASNWRALAEYVSLQVQQPTLLLDIGSTTTDILNILPNQVFTSSKTDLDRLTSHELVYTGVERSSVSGLLRTFIFHRTEYPIVNELFATTSDAYRVLGHLPCSNQLRETADGREQTRESSCQRLARTLGTDAECVGEQLLIALAEAIFLAQRELIGSAITSRLQAFDSACEHVILSGHGDFLANAVLSELKWTGQVSTLQDSIGPQGSRASCAFAVAKLLEQHL